MAGGQDDSQKTEEPTAKKREDAFKKGDVPRSQEVRHWFMLVTMAIILSTIAPGTAVQLKTILGGIIANSSQFPADGAGILHLVRGIIMSVGYVLAVPMTFIIAGALAGAMLQHRPVLSWEKPKPKFSNLSPAKGFKRMFSSNSIVEFLKTTLKFVIVGGVVVYVIWPDLSVLSQMTSIPVQDMLNVVVVLMLRLLIGVIAIMTIIAGMDVIYQRFQHTKKLRMSKQEIKDEHKQLDGDPHIKARIRQIRNERARRRMMAAVPESDVVITNPTHYAVALKYDFDTMDVPVVVAKGIDEVAQRIRKVAAESDVPIIENPPLARSLHATVEIDDEIDADHYRAVAEVIGYVLKLKNKMPKRPKHLKPAEDVDDGVAGIVGGNVEGNVAARKDQDDEGRAAADGAGI